MAELMKAPKNGVKVRMYRPGLGDCFLLAFPSKSGKDVYMLIDFGVLTGTANAEQTMADIARDIKESTDGTIDVVVITHEHYDHVSGFDYDDSRSVFDDIEFKQVWVAWTDDPKNPLAKKLKKSIKLQYQALGIASKYLKANGNTAADRIESLLGFSENTNKAYKYVLGKVDAPMYLKPGHDPDDLNITPAARFFVLGPPENEKQLGKMNPSKKGDQVYELAIAQQMAGRIFATSVLSHEPDLSLDEEEKELLYKSQPFDNNIGIDPSAAKGMEFFVQNYGFGDAKTDDQSWRRIDRDWMAGADGLALQLDSKVNNTSLVLAIELIHKKQVLLFAGDAQVGNWMSWHDVSWDLDGDEINATDLLKRTVFYKVGHHGSHNATLKTGGLELMENPDLVAMIPVDEERAKKKKWKMPFKPMLDRLEEKAKGRIIRSDTGVYEHDPDRITKKDWKKFAKSVNTTDLYIEFTI
jgi:beta-lactamase superfamily II metal-dependent hydrolase